MSSGTSDSTLRPASPPLLERDLELSRLEGALAAARASDGSFTFLSGPAGIGKSRLLDELQRSARRRDVTVLYARGADSEREFAFGVVLQLFGTLVGTASASDRAALLGGHAALAAPLVDTAVSPAPRDADASVFPLLHGLFWLTANLSERAPLLLVVDDAHWADEMSLRFLLYLVRRLDDLPVAVVATARPGEGEHEALLAELRAVAAEELVPAPLSPAGVAAVVRSAVGEDADDLFCAACVDATAGNPFLVRELLAVLAAERIPPTADAAGRVRTLGARSVALRVLVRFGRLAPQAATLARALAVLGDETPLRLAAALARLGWEDAVAAADQLARVEIVRPGEPLAFVHPLVRSSVYDDVSRLELADAHARAARLLHAGGAPDERIAHHLLLAPMLGEGWASEVLRSAAQRAWRLGAPATAAQYLERALAEPLDPAQRSDVLVGLGRAAAATGDQAAVAHVEAALELVDDPVKQAATYLVLGRIQARLGDSTTAAATLDLGIEALDDRDLELALELQTEYVWTAWHVSALNEEALRRLGGLLDVGAATAATTAGRGCLGNAAIGSLVLRPDHLRARELARLAWADGQLIESDGADSQTVYSVTGALTYSDDLLFAEHVTTAALGDAERRGSVTAFALASYVRAVPRYFMGRLADSLADLEQALRAWGDTPGVAYAGACGYRGYALLERDQSEEAERALAAADADPRIATSVYYAFVLHARARLAAAAGRYEEALELCRRAGVQGGDFARSPAFMPWRSDAAIALGALGRDHEARELADEELRLARALGAPRSLGIALRGAALARRGPEAVDLLREAVEVLEGSPAALERVRALVDYGAALRRNGNRAQAREPLRRSADLAASLGAYALQRRATEELVAAGGRRRPDVRSGVEALTAGELRVAELVAQRLSNRQVAQALFVTPKAVEWHLANIFRKLGISSRSEVGAALAVATPAQRLP